MLGKILRLALMDKQTRARWEAARAGRETGRVEPKAARAGTQARPPARPSPGEAEASADGAEAPSARQPGAADAPSAAVSAVAASAESAERRQLIHNAMTIHKMKQSALQDLDPETRARLRDMAEQVFGVNDDADGGDGDGRGGGGSGAGGRG